MLDFRANSLSCLVRLTSDSWLPGLHPISLQECTLNEYCVWGSNMVALYVTSLALPLDMTSLVLRSMLKGALPAMILRMYKMNLSTGLLPSKVGVHLRVIERESQLTMVTFSGGSGCSVKE